jgi:hypothetical protein
MSLINFNEIKYNGNKNIYFVIYNIKNYNNNKYYCYYLYQYENIDLFNNIIIFPFINSNNEFLKDNIYNFIKKYELNVNIEKIFNYNDDVYVLFHLNEKLKVDLKKVTLHEICNLKKYFIFDIHEKVYNLFLNNNFLLTLHNNISNPYVCFFNTINNDNVTIVFDINSTDDKQVRYLFFIDDLNYDSDKNIFYDNNFKIKNDNYIFKNFNNLLKF